MADKPRPDKPRPDKPRPDKPRAPKHTYWRGDTLWCRFTVAGREVRESLQTGSPGIAARRVAALRDKAIGRAKFGEHVVSWEDAGTAWARYIAGQVGSPRTVKRYADSLSIATPHFAGRPIADLGKDHVNAFVTARRAGGVSNATIRRDLQAISSLLDFAEDEGWREGNPARDKMRRLKEHRDPITLPDEADIAFVLSRLAPAHADMLRAARATGMRQAELIALYREGVADAATGSRQASTAEYMTLGARAKGADVPAAMGDPLKCDMVCTLGGYAADMSRNFVFGPPSADQAELHAIAERAFEAGLAELMPGRPISGVHRAATESLARQGLRSYRRGHFGHGVGQSVFSEQWPYIAADCDAEIEAGMVLAYEIPLYIDGLASFNLEDQFLITTDGPVSMNRLPRTLGVIG